MPKVTGVTIAATALILMALTGCAGGADDAGGSAESAAPLVAESPQAPAVDDADVAFLESVRANLPADTIIPNATDEQLLVAGKDACDQRADDPTGDNISVIEGEERSEETGYFMNSQPIVNAAWQNLCPLP